MATRGRVMSSESWQDAFFTQAPPRLGNQFRDDPLLGPWLRRTVPPAVLAALNRPSSTTTRRGWPAASSTACSSPTARNEPVLTQWDAWGNRVDASRCRRCGARPSASRPSTGWSRRPTSARYGRLRAHRAVRDGLPVPPVDRRLHLPARDDRRRGAHAARSRATSALIDARRAAPDRARSGAVLDQRPVDDRAHRRLRRRPLARRAPAGRRRAGGSTAASGSPRRSRRRWRSRSRGPRATRRAAGASRCSTSRCATRRAA